MPTAKVITVLAVVLVTLGLAPDGAEHFCSHELTSFSVADTLLPIDDTDKIVWAENYPFRWSDFEAQPDSLRTYIAALTSSAVIYSYYCHNDELLVKAKAVFRKKESWVRPEAKTNNYLRHEKRHFDITEIHARKVRQMVSSRCFTCAQTQQLNAAIDSILYDWRRTDKLYDRQTHFSHHLPKQQDWEYQIDSLLTAYHFYKSDIW